jgi:Gas vesicle synthesis protein GvpL/GvpF
VTCGTLRYLYAVVDAAGVPAPPLGPGVDGAEVTVLTEGPLAAVLSEVPADRFGEPALRSRLEDLDWLAELARAHHRVIDRISRVTAVAPLRMATVMEDQAAVRDLLASRRASFAEVLDRVRGRQEWGVKAYVLTGGPTADDTDIDSPGAGPGTAYLLRRRGQRQHAQRAVAAGVERARRLHELLSQHAVDARNYPPQDPRLSGRPEPMVLNAAYLVPADQVDALRAEAARFDAAGLRVELTGPWAPYSFAQDSGS